MEEEVIYKGLTRPAMVFGVPIVPFFVASSAIALLSLYTTMLFLGLLAPVIFIMKEITKKDDLIFRQLFLNMKFWKNPASKRFFQDKKTYITSSYDEIPVNFNAPKLSIIALNSVPNFKELIPYDSIVDNFIITKNYDILATWSIDGIAFEVENDDMLEFNKQKINMLLRQFDNKQVSFYIHSARYSIEDKFDSLKFGNEFLTEQDKAYYKSFEKKDLKQNTYYLTAVFSPLNKVALRSSFKKDSLDKRIKEMNDYVKTFRNYCVTIEANLADFKTIRLGKYEQDGVIYSSQLEFYNYLISGKFQKVRSVNAPLYEYLNGDLSSISFGSSTMQLNFNNGTKRFAKAIEIKDYPNHSWTGMFDLLMYEDIDYTMTQSFIPLPKSQAKSEVDIQRKRLNSAEDDAVSQIAELDEALDNLVGGNLVFGNYHFSLMIYADSVAEVEKKSNKAMTILGDCGFLTSLANIALPATYFSQFVSNFSIRPRIHTISSLNFSSFNSLHNFVKGKRHGNQWGEAVTIFKTPNKQPYYFNFHETSKGNDFSNEITKLANTVILGYSGAGKTVLMSFLLNQLCKYTDKDSFANNTPENKKKATFFYLDKDKATIANIFAIGGKYITLDYGKPTGFNPFQVEATSQNITRLQTLIKMLVTRNDEKLLVSEERALNSAVEAVMLNFSKQNRKHGISMVLQHLTQKNDEINALKARLTLWSYGQKFGYVFDNENDTLSFDDENISVYGLDGTDLLNDTEISSVVAFYILWRIMDLTDGRRFALFIDEAWNWLLNPVVAMEVFNKLKTIRKQNGFLVMATQSVEDFAKLPIATAIIEQSPTAILLSNPKANEDDYVKILKISKEEYDFVKTTPPTARQFLVRKGSTTDGDRTIASLDLKSLGKVNLGILSTPTNLVEYIENIIYDDTRNYEQKLSDIKKLYA
ncbi:VirB3 family type IV secretion system protein (plasmid) [Campylobacter fetus]|uniref:VirB3 family type IV secretion system protein n=1 Tax=Campylobacter fetus TaxID=196 RepID=A0A974MV80_CAMFE|nr:VirB3 family type IV secretion system protein [Campylobacter fetus]OCS32906.1 type IV secretion system protein VirB4 [Campylobacter fetus subsp. venerealis]QMS59909.1 VirB3 family type IV secretion system protein [Campylobacter fetus]